MAIISLKIKQSFVLGFLLTMSAIIACCGYPLSSDKRDAESESTADSASDTDVVNDIHERLKLGDRNAWDEMGPAVVDAVNMLIDKGIARSPVHALLILFWPDSTKHEHEQMLARVEPMVRSSYEDYFSAAAAASTPESEPESESESENVSDSEHESASEPEPETESQSQSESEPQSVSESEERQSKRSASINDEEFKNEKDFLLNEVGPRQYWPTFGEHENVQYKSP